MTASVPVVRTIWRLLWKCLCFPRKLHSIPSESLHHRKQKSRTIASACLSHLTQLSASGSGWGSVQRARPPRTWPLVIWVENGLGYRTEGRTAKQVYRTLWISRYKYAQLSQDKSTPHLFSVLARVHGMELIWASLFLSSAYGHLGYYVGSRELLQVSRAKVEPWTSQGCSRRQLLKQLQFQGSETVSAWGFV